MLIKKNTTSDKPKNIQKRNELTKKKYFEKLQNKSLNK